MSLEFENNLQWEGVIARLLPEGCPNNPALSGGTFFPRRRVPFDLTIWYGDLTLVKCSAPLNQSPLPCGKCPLRKGVLTLYKNKSGRFN